LQFDGKNDYVDCGNDASLNITDAITIEAWVKPNEKVAWMDIVDKAGSYRGYRLYICSSDKLSPDSIFSVRAIFGDGTDWLLINKQYIIYPNNWYHIVTTYNNGSAKLYVNGAEVASGSGGAMVNATVPLTIGGTSYLDGLIDEVRIYNRALSAEEVRYHYNHGGPVAAWDMDEGSGAKINDQSGNHNDGTISGATWTSGKYGSALQFDGVNDYVDCGNDASLNITSAITIEAWVKTNIVPTVDNRYYSVISKTFGGPSNNNKSWGLFLTREDS